MQLQEHEMTLSSIRRGAAARHPLVLRHFLRWLGLARVIRQHRQALLRLDPHLLRDIGLTQEQAETEARRPIWDVPGHWRD
jgi:uncharacterized protein YjiS (DUF1127 family)